DIREVTLSLPSRASKAVDFIEKRTEVVERDWVDDRSIYTIKIGRNQFEQLLSRERNIRIGDEDASVAIEKLWAIPFENGECCQLPPHKFQEE
ncbi:MAG: hypothetical protein HOH93_06705, partial [Phycisphaerae bacterium]|nr:hypothetical protein [Phycisphaerae bacterium]